MPYYCKMFSLSSKLNDEARKRSQCKATSGGDKGKTTCYKMPSSLGGHHLISIVNNM